MKFLLLSSGIFIILILLMIIRNMCLTLNEIEEKYEHSKKRLNSLNSYFDKLKNISFPISYSLSFYENYSDLPVIYVITPTNNRVLTQLAHLTRLRNTLWLVPKIFWIVIEDSSVKTEKIKKFLETSKIQHVHLCEQTTDDLILKPNEKLIKHRGVLQRNKAIEWLRNNSNMLDLNGVVYFADDDNTYDIRLFEEMRYTKKVSVWPVGLVGTRMYERPFCQNGKVTGWLKASRDKRQFATDMAGFAVNLKLLLAHPSARFSLKAPLTWLETQLLSDLVGLNDLEAKAENCTKIYVWYTQTRQVNRLDEKTLLKFNIKYEKSFLEQV